MLPFCNLLIQQTFIKGPLYFGHCARLNTKMNREKTSTVLKCLTGVFSCRRLWVTTAYSLGQTTTPGHQVIKCIFPRVSCILWKVCLGQGTVDITLFDCAPGDWPCCSEAIPFCEVNVRVAHGVMVGGLGGKYFRLKRWGVWVSALAVRGSDEKCQLPTAGDLGLLVLWEVKLGYDSSFWREGLFLLLARSLIGHLG